VSLCFFWSPCHKPAGGAVDPGAYLTRPAASPAAGVHVRGLPPTAGRGRGPVRRLLRRRLGRAGGHGVSGVPGRLGGRQARVRWLDLHEKLPSLRARSEERRAAATAGEGGGESGGQVADMMEFGKLNTARIRKVGAGPRPAPARCSLHRQLCGSWCLPLTPCRPATWSAGHGPAHYGRQAPCARRAAPPEARVQGAAERRDHLLRRRGGQRRRQGGAHGGGGLLPSAREVQGQRRARAQGSSPGEQRARRGQPSLSPHCWLVVERFRSLPATCVPSSLACPCAPRCRWARRAMARRSWRAPWRASRAWPSSPAPPPSSSRCTWAWARRACATSSTRFGRGAAGGHPSRAAGVRETRLLSSPCATPCPPRSQARSVAPCVIFIDELDAVRLGPCCGSRAHCSLPSLAVSRSCRARVGCAGGPRSPGRGPLQRGARHHGEPAADGDGRLRGGAAGALRGEQQLRPARRARGGPLTRV
jgi:hypothetical protein